ncbi:SseB family protein [Micromonospora rubida]|uniref:SseB family protein n=1 Tax=Micromonospora rubida TaxID=2697657 RepID=UPI00137681E6|nr:SseB family protein [Micromonospora rubida]NBE82727.1 hypothetical protein [Micromonospora rubida]
MTDWEPATEAEAAMRDALRANDQELYFRVLARTELLLPVSTQALAGQAPMGWGTWTTGGRTHVLAFTSSAALQACLGGNPAASRRSGYAELAVDWPNHEWWLAVNPGLPIEGYLPAWFVSQLSRGDVRLPGRTMGARARLERAENVARTRATAVVPGRDAPTSPTPSLPEPSVAGPPPGRPTTESSAAEAPTTSLTTARLATAPPESVLPTSVPPTSVPTGPSYRSPGGAGEPAAGSPYRAGDVAGRPGPATAGGPDGAGETHTDAPPSGSAWLNVSRRRTPDAPPTGEAAAGGGGNGRPPEPPAPPTPPTPPASFFEPASGRSRAARPIGEPRRPAERAAPPSRFAGGAQPFPRRRPASDPATEQPPHAFHPATPAEPSTVAFPPAGAAPAASQPEPFRPGGVGSEELTRAFRPDGGGPEELTRAFRPDGGGSEEVTRAFRPGDVGPGERTQALRIGAVGPGEVTRAFRPGEATSPAPSAEDPTRALRPGGAAPPEPPRVSPPQAEPTQAFRPVAPGDEPTRPIGVPGGVLADEPTRPLGPTGGDEPTRPLGADGAGPDGGLSRRRPGAGAAQAFPRPRPGADGEEPTRPLAEQPVAAPVEETAEELPTSAVEPVSGPPASRRSFSPIVIEGTIIEARDLPATGPAGAPGAVPGPSLFGGSTPAPTSMPDLGGLDPVPELDRIDPVSDLGWPAPPPLPDHDQGSPGHGQGDLGQGQGEAAPPLGFPAGAGVVSGPPAPDDPGPTAVLFAPSTPPASDPSAESLFRPALSGHVDPEPAVEAVPTGPLPGPSAAGESVLRATEEPDPARAGEEPRAGEPVAIREPEQAASATPAADFRPANEVEEDLLAAAGTGSTDSFLSTLLLARVLLPVAPDSAPDSRPGDPGFVWRTERLDGETYVVVHTSPERLADHVDEPVETVRVKFVQLIRCWPDDAWSFAVNPNTSVGAKLPGEQIVALANWAAEVGLGDDAGSEPEPEPEPAAEASTGAARHVPPPVDPNRPVVMQKAIAPSQLTYYLERGYDRVSGFVHRANELAHLNSPAQLHDALGLGYPDSPFSRDAAQIYVLRWPAHRPSLYRIPYGGQNEGAMRAMEGWVMERPPFRGNGFAPGDSSDVVAEFKVDSARLPHGAELWRIGADGTERVVATLDTDALLWRQVGES